jgi:chromodomain-helicase-DNA-binding protein 4
MGWCRIKLAGVEHCGLCGIAHLGHSRTCPHLTDETQVGRLLQTLKESPEPREYVEAATKYLRMIRGDLVQRKRKKMEQDLNRTMQMGHNQQQGHHQNIQQQPHQAYHQTPQQQQQQQQQPPQYQPTP